jgi:hypothetical protein
MSVVLACGPRKSTYNFLLILLGFLLIVPASRGQAANGDLNPLAFPGPDIGAKVNAAFASCAGAPCSVVLPPAERYSQATQIVIPAAMGQVLDCQYTTLSWTGSGDAISVTGLNGDSPTGAIRHCVIALAAGNTAGVNGVTQHARIWFNYDGDIFAGWVNPGSHALEFLNDAVVGWNGPAGGAAAIPAYNERTHIENTSFSNNTVGLYFHLGGGTNSYGRNFVEAYFNLMKDQVGILVDNGAYVYNGMFDVHANAGGGGNAVVKLVNSSVLNPATGNFEGEGTGCGLETDASNDIFAVTSDLMTKRCLGGPSDQEVTAPGNLGFMLQTRPFGSGLRQATNTKFSWDGEDVRFGMPTVGGYHHGYFQLFNRDTSGNPEVDDEAEHGAPQQNIMDCIGADNSLGAAGGCGFGPGFGPAATRGGNHQPRLALESSGGLALTGTQGVNHGQRFQTTYDAKTGNLVDYFSGGSQAGQPSYSRVEEFYDLTTYANEIGMSRYAAGGLVHYVTPTLKIGDGVELTNSNAIPQVAAPKVGQVACIKAPGPPVVIGYCAGAVSATGACPCK